MDFEENKKKKRSIDGFIPISNQDSKRSRGFSDSFNSSGNKIDDFSGKNEGLDRLTSNQQITSLKTPANNSSSAGAESKNRFSLKSSQKLDRWDKSKKRQKRKRIILTALSIVIISVGYLLAKGVIDLNKAFSGGGGAAALNQNVDPAKLNVEGDGRINILLLGRGGVGHEGPDLTDTIILVSIDPIDKSAGLVSIPRDLFVTVPTHGSMKINSVFYSGKTKALNQEGKSEKQAEEEGLKLTEKTVEEVLGVPVHYHAMIDFKGFMKAVDTVGGVDVNVPKSVQEKLYINGKDYLLNVKAGPKHFEGFEALAYSRSRYTSARGDFDRAERQRLMIIGLKEKVLSVGTFSNPSKISKLVEHFGNNTRTNFSLEDINKIYSVVKDVNNNNVQSIGLADPPNFFLETGNVAGQSVVLPVAGQGNYTDINYYIRNTLRDSFMKQEDSGVVILNGTDQPGLATQKAQELRSYGYKVTRVGDAPKKNYQTTTLIDMGHKDNKYTKNYLQKRLHINAVGTLPDSSIRVGTNDFVIIIGNDTTQ